MQERNGKGEKEVPGFLRVYGGLVIHYYSLSLKGEIRKVEIVREIEEKLLGIERKVVGLDVKI